MCAQRVARLWVVGFFLIVSAARADDLAWTVTSPSSGNTSSTAVHGTEFTPSGDIQVTSLGYYDDTYMSADGLSASHEVGIYRVSTQELVVSATVPAGTAAPKTNHFRFVPVTPVTLQAGVTYIVAGVITGDPRRNVTPGSSMLVHSWLTLGPWKSAYTSTLSCPTTFMSDTTRSVGPSFTFVVQEVQARLLWTLDPASQAVGNSGLNGTEFTPRSSIVVTSLGWYDDTYSTPEGLSSSHAVGIFNALSGAMLVSGIVPSGTSAPKANQFRVIGVPDTRLRAGVPYVVAGIATGDPGRNVGPGDDMHLDSEIILGPWRMGIGQTLAFPSTVIDTSTRFMGPTAGFEPVSPVLGWDIAPPSGTNNSTGVMGTEFTPEADIQVQSLGWYDDTLYSPDGLAADHPVAIYRVSDQAAVVSTMIPAGTGTRKVSYFRFVDIPPVTLHAGVAYVVAGLVNGDGGQNVTPGSSMMVHNALTIGPWRIGGSVMGFPDYVLSTTTRRVGPTFEYMPPVPDADKDGIPDIEDLCPGTPAGTLVDAGGCPLQFPGDLDGNQRVDSNELNHVISCQSGPKIAIRAGCSDADLDHDSDVDQSDFGLIQRCFSGAALADPACVS